MKRESLYRSLTIATPIVAFVCATGVTVYEWQRLKQLEKSTIETEHKLTAIDNELRSFDAQPPTEKYPTVAKTPKEQAEFLDTLRANADICKVQLVRWSNTTPPPAPPPAQATDKPASGLPSGVAAIISIVEVSGRSDNTRQFLYNILRSRRLLNMCDIKWVRDQWPNTHLMFTLTRYVAPPVELPVDHGHADHAVEDGHGHAAVDAHGEAPAPGTPSTAPIASPPPHTVGAVPPHGVALPNPMDAPGIAHGTYQTRLEAGVSQLNEIDQSQPGTGAHSPAATNTKR